jgi:hypothetical protein
MFDFATVEDGKIVDRIQQADMFGQMRRLFGPLGLTVLIGLCVLLFGAGLPVRRGRAATVTPARPLHRAEVANRRCPFRDVAVRLRTEAQFNRYPIGST